MPNKASNNQGRSSQHRIHPDERTTHQISSEEYEGILSARWEDLTDVGSPRKLAEMIVDTVRDAILVLDLDLRVKAANESFFSTFEIKPDQVLDQLVYELHGRRWDIPELRELLEQILPEKKSFTDFEVAVNLPELGHRVFLLNGRQLDDHELILLAFDDVSELRQWTRKLEERVKERTRTIRDLASALTMAEQKERRRISSILHDDLQQILYAADIRAKIAFENAERGELDAAQQELVRERELLKKCIDLTRNLSVDLSPPILTGQGLTETLAWLASRMKELHGLHVTVESVQSFYTPEHDMRVLLFQVVRELLFNVSKHAGTNAATVEVRSPNGSIEITVGDEGQGFDVEAAESQEDSQSTFGLFSLRERLGLFGGKLHIDSEPGAGTRVTVEVPLALE